MKIFNLTRTALLSLGVMMSIPAFAVTSETVLFEGKQLLEKPNGTPLKVAADKLAGVAAEDVLTVYFTVAGLGTVPSITLQYGATKMACNATKSNTNDAGNFDNDATYTSTVIKEEGDVEGLKAKGLQLTGRNVYITKIVLAGEGSQPDVPDTPDTPDPSGDQTILSSKDILPELGSTGWNTSYNADTHTITYNEAWGGSGWWLDDADYSQYTNVYVKCGSTKANLKFTIEYNAAPSAEFAFENGVVNAVLSTTGKKSVKQMYIQSSLEGDVTVLAAELREIEAPKASYSVLWSGTHDVDNWASDLTIEASKFVGVKGGDKIKITLDVNPGAEFGIIELDDLSYSKLNCSDNSEGLNSDKCIDSSVTEVTYILSNSDAAAVSGNGLRIKGANVTIKQVELVEGEALEPDPEPVKVQAIWTGSVNCGQWKETVNVEASKFTQDLKAGDKLCLYLTRNAGAGKGMVEVDDQTGAALDCNGQGTNMTSDGTIDKNAKEVVYTLGENDIKRLQASGLTVKGFAVTVTGAYLQFFDESQTSGIEIATENTEIEYFDLMGRKVINPANGIYVKRQGSKVSKVMIR